MTGEMTSVSSCLMSQVSAGWSVHCSAGTALNRRRTTSPVTVSDWLERPQLTYDTTPVRVSITD